MRSSEVDPTVLAGEPDSASQLEGGDDDLLSAEPDQLPSVSGERQAADALLEGKPTALGE